MQRREAELLQNARGQREIDEGRFQLVEMRNQDAWWNYQSGMQAAANQRAIDDQTAEEDGLAAAKRCAAAAERNERQQKLSSASQSSNSTALSGRWESWRSCERNGYPQQRPYSSPNSTRTPWMTAPASGSNDPPATTTTTSPNNVTTLFNFDGGEANGEAEAESSRRRRRKQDGNEVMGNDDLWVGEATLEEEIEENTAGGSAFDMRPDEEHPDEEPAFDMTMNDQNFAEEFDSTQVESGTAPVGAQANHDTSLAQEGRNIDERAEHLHQIAKHRSIARFGTAGWSQAIDEDASLASLITETAWWKDDLTEDEAIRLMSETFSKIVRERKEKEGKEDAEAAAVAPAVARAEEGDKEEHGCQSGTCGMC